MFNFLFFIPRLVVKIIWQLIWSLIKIGSLFAIVVLLLLFYAQNSNSALANQISTFSNNLSTYFNSEDMEDVASDVTEVVSNLKTDHYSNMGSTRWSQKTATVYIATQDETLISAYKEAISNWNSTGAFTFTMTSDQNKADIIATDYSDKASQAAGLANTTTDMLTNRITHVEVMLNTYYLTSDSFGYTYERIVNTAEHELGHAIGLDHDDSQQSVMQSSGSYYGIQTTDITTVQKLYTS
nr:M57 family metalloprotease [Streptococcus saliviloxodontae]